jgi:hypothetical protein
MAITLTEDDVKALNKHIDGVLTLFQRGDIEQFKARAELEHLVTLAANDDAGLHGFLRAGIDPEVIDGDNAEEIDDSVLSPSRY